MWRYLLILLVLVPGTISAQNRSTIFDRTRNKKESSVETIIYVELLTGRAGNGLTAQRWSQFFRDEKVQIRIRRGRSLDKIENKELSMGPLRKVTLVGQIEPNGILVFEQQKFRQTETEKLANWLDDIRKYGVQGSPQGKKLWGLNEEQFNQVYKVLSAPMDQSTEGKSFTEALRAFDLPRSLPHFVSQDAKDWLVDQKLVTSKLETELSGVSKGTALAIMLRNYGLAGYPLRMADGSLRFQIEPEQEKITSWPIGWDLKNSNKATAPKLFKFEQERVDEEVPSTAVLQAISAKSGVPIFLDQYYMKIHHIDLSEEMFSMPPRNMALMSLVKKLTTPHFLRPELKIDERGKPLIWVSCLKADRNKKK